MSRLYQFLIFGLLNCHAMLAKVKSWYSDQWPHSFCPLFVSCLLWLSFPMNLAGFGQNQITKTRPKLFKAWLAITHVHYYRNV